MYKHSAIQNTNAHQQKKGSFFTGVIQPKLTINEPGDACEKEADAVADKVLRMPKTSPLPVDNKPFFSSPTVNISNINSIKRKALKKENKEEETQDGLPEIQFHKSFDASLPPPDGKKVSDAVSIQRKCAHCEEEEKKAQRKENNNNATEASTETENYVNTLSGGNTLNEKDKSFFEARMGYDLSGVRVHTDNNAARSARSIDALAYTSGNNIVFDKDQYQPSTEPGKKLLAHELTHVIQQNNGGISKKIQRTLNYLRQLPEDECRPYLSRFDLSLQELETNAQSPHAPIPQEVLLAIRLLRRFRREGRITCWETSGGRIYASYDNATQRIRLHVNWGPATSPGTIVHEAIHALHAANYPEIARVYGLILSQGQPTDRNLIILTAKWKAWTEYWAYRGTTEYDNSRQTEARFRRDAHDAAMAESNVRESVQRVRELTGQDFDPSQWTPPAHWRAPAAYRRQSP